MISFKQFVKESEEYNGFNGVPFTPSPIPDGTEPSIHGVAALPMINHEGHDWYHGGRVAVNPLTNERLFQYLKRLDTANDDNGQESVWANAIGQVRSKEEPPSMETAATHSIKTK